MRHSGVESCSSGVRFDAGHQSVLAPVVGIANIVQEVKTGTNTADSDLNPTVQLSPSAHYTALTPHTAAGTGFASGRFLKSAAPLVQQQQRRGTHTAKNTWPHTLRFTNDSGRPDAFPGNAVSTR